MEISSVRQRVQKLVSNCEDDDVRRAMARGLSELEILRAYVTTEYVEALARHKSLGTYMKTYQRGQ